MVVLLLLRGHLLRILCLGLLVFTILLRWAIHGLLWLRLITLLVGLILLLCRLPIWLVGLVIGRLLWRLVIWRLLWLLPRIAHVPHGIQVPGTPLGERPDHKKGQGDDQYNKEYREHHVEDKPGHGEAKRKDDWKHYWYDMREKVNPTAAAVWSIVIVHFLVPL